jgi:uncharacterized protein (TIGR03663 family)
VSTASTKSRNPKQNRKTETAESKTKAAGTLGLAAQESPPAELSERVWTICSLLILAVAAILRLYHLSLVPFHHDEGVNGNFLVRLVREGFYHYDPENYHGPTLYYFTAIISWILRFFLGESAQNTYGLNTVTLRLVPALFGLATIWLVLLLRRHIGTVGSLCAAALLAVSPGAVYLARYFIHETLFVFFTLAVVVAVLKFYEDGHPVYLVLASASAALLFATKETFIINVPVLLLAFASTKLYQWLRLWFRKEQKSSKKSRGRRETYRERLENRVAGMGGPTRLLLLGGLAVAVFVLVSVLFYSSFFTNSKGIYDSLRTFQVWTKTGQSAHTHPSYNLDERGVINWKYIEWLGLQESPLLLLGVMGAGLALWRPKNTFALFAAFWAFGTLAAYSLVPYKTPWLCLNFIVPLALVAGSVFQTLYSSSGRHSLPVLVPILALAVSLSSYQAIDLDFFNYDNDRKTVGFSIGKYEYKPQYYVYVYAHTRREMLALVDEINRIAKASGEGDRIGITIVSPDYWPLPWYLRDYKRVGYHGGMTTSNEPIIIAKENQGAEVQAMYGDRYRQISSGFNEAGGYALRPAVDLLLYVRNDVPQ